MRNGGVECLKQRITVEQLCELNKAQRKELRKWWKPQTYDVVLVKDSKFMDGGVFAIQVKGRKINSIYDAFGECRDSKSYLLPLMTIGQCIEFLEEHRAYEPNNWRDSNERELIDSLWNSVKAVLK